MSDSDDEWNQSLSVVKEKKHKKKAQELYDEAKGLVKQGKFKAGLEVLKKAYSLDPDVKYKKRLKELEEYLNSDDSQSEDDSRIENNMQELALASDKSREDSDKQSPTRTITSNENVNSSEHDEDIVCLSDNSNHDQSASTSGKQTTTTPVSQTTQEESDLEPSTSSNSNRHEISGMAVKITGSKYVDIEGFPVKKSVYEKLYPYQVEGVKWLLNLYKTANEKKVENYKFYRGCILADDMG